MVKQERAARTRQALVRAAAEVFAREGFAPASLAVISARAGVSNGALHFHFENKNALARAVEQEAAERLGVIIAPGPVLPGGALQALVDATHVLMGALADDVVVRAGFDLSADPSRPGGPDLRGVWRGWVERMLHDAEREGHLAEGLSSRGAAPAVVAATVGFEVLGAADREWLSAAKITGFWELMLPRLAPGLPIVPAGPHGTPTPQ
ncbi:ScbR family autoregulator-binding transcription factor [Streptomyces pristinaespiralis]|uniref:ScbR family autoregulator-binding transcription factor n=1 Tax=Streptomyces pristinaespiralis TaxID=38300 RepID=UPI00378F0B03